MSAYLQIILDVANENRGAAAEVYAKFKEPFLNTVPGAESKSLLVRSEDVQVLHGFSTAEAAQAYLDSDVFKDDVVGELGPLLAASPEIRIYEAH